MLLAIMGGEFDEGDPGDGLLPRLPGSATDGERTPASPATAPPRKRRSPMPECSLAEEDAGETDGGSLDSGPEDTLVATVVPDGNLAAVNDISLTLVTGGELKPMAATAAAGPASPASRRRTSRGSPSSTIRHGELTVGRRCVQSYRATLDGVEADQTTAEADRLVGRVRQVRIPLWCPVAVGSFVRALVLAQLLHYLAGIKRDGTPRAHKAEPGRGLPEDYIYMSARMLAAQVGLTARQVEHVLGDLRRGSFIVTANKLARHGGPLNGRRCLHIWLGHAAKQWLGQLADKVVRHAVVLLWAMRACGGDLPAAMVLSYAWLRLHHRLGRGDRAARAPHPCCDDPRVPLSREDAARWLGLSVHQVKRALQRLQLLGLIGPRPIGASKALRVNYEVCIGYVLLLASERADELAGWQGEQA